MSDQFADRFVNLAIHRGVARLDFARLESIDPEKKEARFSPAMRLVMPVDAFMHMTEQLCKVREEILKQDTQASYAKVEESVPQKGAASPDA